MFKKLCILAALIFTPFVMAASTVAQSPYEKTEIAADTIFKAINEQSAQIKNNPDILKSIVQKDLIPYVHVKYAAALALGAYYKDVPKDKRDAYFSAFESYLVHSFAQALSMYSGQTYQVESAQNIEGKNIVAVKVMLISADKNQPPIRLDFQWRKNTATGEWQAYDMAAEGISMISTKQTEWSSTIRQQGIDALIKLLKEQSAAQIDPNQQKQAN